MRYVSFVIAVFVLLLAAVPAFSASDTREQFHEWALKKGEGFDTDWNDKIVKKQRADLDKRWNKIAISKESKPRSGRGSSSSYKRAGTSRTYGNRPQSGGSQRPVSGSGFIHKSNHRFLPSSTRPRNGPSRGTSSLRNPAQTSRGFARDGRRGLRSNTRIRNIFGQNRGVSRPRVKSPGRRSQFNRRGRSFSRPRTRADRPRRFR